MITKIIELVIQSQQPLRAFTPTLTSNKTRTLEKPFVVAFISAKKIALTLASLKEKAFGPWHAPAYTINPFDFKNKTIEGFYYLLP